MNVLKGENGAENTAEHAYLDLTLQIHSFEDQIN